MVPADPGPVAALDRATFGPDGPESCSGRPVQRYDADRLTATVASGVGVEPVAERIESHPTPGGATQQFTWVALRRT